MDFYWTSQTQHVQNWTYLSHPQACHTHNLLHLSWWQLLSVAPAKNLEVTLDFLFYISHSIQFKKHTSTSGPLNWLSLPSGMILQEFPWITLISFKSPLQWNLPWEPSLILQLVSFPQSCTSFSPYPTLHFFYSGYYILLYIIYLLKI